MRRLVNRSAALHSLAIAYGLFGAAPQEQSAPPRPAAPRQARDAGKKPESLQPDKFVWSRYSSDQVPSNVEEPNVDELAAKLGLERVAPAAGATPDAFPRFRHKRTGMLFVFVPGGSFKMGSNYSALYNNNQVMESSRRGKVGEHYFSWEQPQADVYVSPFFIGMYEVTNAEYRAFLDAWHRNELPAACEFPFGPPKIDHTPFLYDRRELPFWGERQPVVGVGFLDAWAFSHWMGGRPPTEAEWEKAARGTDDRIFPWGNRFDPMRANTQESGNRRTLDVGTYPGGRSPYGCYDMAGNALELTLDAFLDQAYRYRKAKDPCLLESHPASPNRCVRGGSWNGLGYLFKSRVTARGMYPMIPRYSIGEIDEIDYLHVGFRVVLSELQDLYSEADFARLKADRDRMLERKREAGAGEEDSGGR